MAGNLTEILRTTALILLLVGGIGNLVMAVRYFIKEKVKRGVIHVLISLIALRGLIHIF
jgi:hypothetical protein